MELIPGHGTKSPRVGGVARKEEEKRKIASLLEPIPALRQAGVAKRVTFQEKLFIKFCQLI